MGVILDELRKDEYFRGRLQRESAAEESETIGFVTVGKLYNLNMILPYYNCLLVAHRYSEI